MLSEVPPPAEAATDATAADPNVEILGVFDRLLAKIALETSQEEDRTLRELGLEGQEIENFYRDFPQELDALAEKCPTRELLGELNEMRNRCPEYTTLAS